VTLSPELLTFYEPDFGKPILDRVHVFLFWAKQRGRWTPASMTRLQPTSIFPHEAPGTGSCGSFVGENAAFRQLARISVDASSMTSARRRVSNWRLRIGAAGQPMARDDLLSVSARRRLSLGSPST
jgi:hypothetical protein